MRLSFLGRDPDALFSELDGAGIKYERWLPKPGQVMNSAIWAKIAEHTPWSAVAKVLVAWQRARASRKITITQNDQKILHIQGMSAEEIEKLLPLCKEIMAIDAQGPKAQLGDDA